MIKLADQVTEPFKPHINTILDAETLEIVNSGGRHSAKSSFAAEITIFGMMEDWHERKEKTHATCIRKIAGTLKSTVYSKIIWTLNIFGIKHLWKCTVSPLKCVYIPSGQEIRFHGCDEPTKLKSSEFEEGYCKYILYEETEEFAGMDEINSVNISLARGEKSIIFYTFNPPPSKDHWVNIEMTKEYPDRLIIHSDYTTVPSKWINRRQLNTIERMKKENYEKYLNIYEGKITGTGGEVFRNVVPMNMKDMIDSFDKLYNGLDFGSAHPTAYTRMHFDNTDLYIFDEVYRTDILNKELKKEIDNKISYNELIKGDNAARNQIRELKAMGLNIIRCTKVKGKDGRDHSFKWLQNLSHIYVDPVRCPNTFRELNSYRSKRNKEGIIIEEFPKLNDDAIDSIRYALDEQIFSHGWNTPNIKPVYY
jgi:PBSX family phage terminase large subunit